MNQNAAMWSRALVDPETQFVRHKRNWNWRRPIVQMRSGLAANGDAIFKPRGGHEGHARTFAFEKNISSYGRAVADLRSEARRSPRLAVGCWMAWTSWCTAS